MHTKNKRRQKEHEEVGNWMSWIYSLELDLYEAVILRELLGVNV